MKRIYTSENLAGKNAHLRNALISKAPQSATKILILPADMASNYKRFLFIACFLLFLLPSVSFSQNCPVNYGFEDSTIAGWPNIGWTCKAGYYGAGTCPTPVQGVCPAFTSVLTTAAGCINANGRNAPLTTGVDRHTLVDKNYYVSGIDPNSTIPPIPAVCPLIFPNNFSFRIGDGVAGGTNSTPGYIGTCAGVGCYARAEGIRFTFLVNINNAGMTYYYASFLQNGGHLPEEQPRLEVTVTRPQHGDSLIPCGYYKVVANNSNPYCSGSTNFHTGVGSWQYSDWTPVALDLSSFLGDSIAIEFKTGDCFLGTGSTIVVNGQCVTTTQNGVTCVSGPSLAVCPDSGKCTGTLTCANQPGSHSSYAYIDLECKPSLLVGYNPKVCIGPSVTIHGPPGYALYSWAPPLNYVSTADSVVVSNPANGTTYSVDLTSKTGCHSKTTVTIHGTEAIVHDTSFCEGTPGNYTLNLTPVANVPVFNWAGPGGFTSTLQNPSIPIPNVTQIYTITVTDTVTSCSDTKTETIKIDLKPTVKASNDTAICSGATVIITATGGGSYSWSSGENTSSISKQLFNSDIFIVTVTNASGCKDTASVNVTVNPLPPVLVSANPTAICSGSSAQLSATLVPNANYSWAQSGTGTIIPPSSNNPTVTPSGTSTYTVFVTVAGCGSTGTTSVTVNPLPAPTASSTPPGICIGSSTQLTTQGGPWAGCVWTGTGNPVGCNPTVAPAIPGTYPYNVTVTDSKGCTGVASTTITVNPNPQPAPSALPSAICIGSSTQLTAGGAGGPWTNCVWTGSGNPSGCNPTVAPATAGTFTYNVTVTDNNNCTGTASTTVTVNPPPVVSVSSPASVCPGFSTQLSAGGGGTYQWSHGPTTDTSTVAPFQTTSYIVTVTDAATFCTATATTTVTVNPNPILPTLTNTSICVGTCHTFDGTSQFGQNYAWLPGPVLTPTLQVCPNIATTNTYTLIASSAFNCTSTGTVSLTSTALPVIATSAPVAICSGSCATVTAGIVGGGFATCSWTGPNLGASNNCTPQACPPNAGSYTYHVTLTDNNGCSDTSSAQVTVNQKPIITVAATPSNLTVCTDSSVVLTASGATGTYAWSGAGVNSPNTDTTTVTPPAGGPNTYMVVGTNANGCSSSTTVVVNAVPPPTVNLDSANICIGQCTQLHASGGLYYTWSPDPSFGSSSLNIPNPTVCPAGTTNYTVTVSNGGNCPPATGSTPVIVHPIPPIYVGAIPSITVGTDTTILAGDTLVLTASGGGISYNWYPESGLSCSTCQQLLAYPLSTTMYYVTTIDQYNCRNSDSILIKVDDVLTLYLPNAFTPDDRSLQNTIFYAYGIGVYQFEFYVFDRWGNKIFETHNLYDGWDGTFKGQKVQQDVYVYLAKARSITGKSITKTGAVTVVK